MIPGNNGFDARLSAALLSVICASSSPLIPACDTEERHTRMNRCILRRRALTCAT